MSSSCRWCWPSGPRPAPSGPPGGASLTAAVLCVGLALADRLAVDGGFDADVRRAAATSDPAQLGFYPLLIGQIALVVFGVLLASAEYTTGTIRASLAAVPRRGLFLAAKACVAAGVAAALAVVLAFGTFFAAQWAARRARHEHSVEPGVLRAVLGAAAYLTLMCVFSMAVATVLRSSALALGILLPLLFLNSQGLSNLPGDPVGDAVPARPGRAPG